MAQFRQSQASASLSSTGYDHARMAAITSSPPALPLPVACFLIANGHALVWDLVMLAPRRERHREIRGRRRSRICRNVAALAKWAVDTVAGLFDLGEPAFESQVAHAAAFETLARLSDPLVI